MTTSAARERRKRLRGRLMSDVRPDLIGPPPHYMTAFPDFDRTLPDLPGFTDHSWREDACPCLWNRDLQLMLFCDYANPRLRAGDASFLYTLSRTDEEGACLQHLLFTDDIKVVRDYLASPAVSSRMMPHAGH